MDDLFEQVRGAAYEIIKRKGATYYAIASGLHRITEAVLRDQATVFSVSNALTGQYGLNGVCLSLPMVVNRQGISKILTLPLNQTEQAGFERSAGILKELAAQTI
jgi:L-lactate dehydrogenase